MLCMQASKCKLYDYLNGRLSIVCARPHLNKNNGVMLTDTRIYNRNKNKTLEEDESLSK